tara:strand:- start:1747 stop:2346 length:600 start_codon:yes stop_codon:yes gene_type:complete
MILTTEHIRSIILEELTKLLKEYVFTSKFAGPTETIYLCFNTRSDIEFFNEKVAGRFKMYKPKENQYCKERSGTADRDIRYIAVAANKNDDFIKAISYFANKKSAQKIKMKIGDEISSDVDRSLTQQRAKHLKEIDRLHTNARSFVRNLNAYVTESLKKRQKNNSKIKLYGMIIIAKCGETIGDFIKYDKMRLDNKTKS